MSGGGGEQQLCRVSAQTSGASGPAGHSTLDWPALDREPVERPLSYGLGNECQTVSFAEGVRERLFKLCGYRIDCGIGFAEPGTIAVRSFSDFSTCIR
jgi:hypothetical protein